jgi:outer membrane protein assembly factor BamB
VVYLGSEEGRLSALDAKTGEAIWQADLGEPASRSAAVPDRIVAIGDNNVVVHAVDMATGEPRWQFQTEGGGVTGTIAIADGTAYFGTQDGETNSL